MKLEEMRKIAEKRTPGKWIALTDRIQQKQVYDDQALSAVIIDSHADPKDLKFYAMAANKFDKLLNLAENIRFESQLHHIAAREHFKRGVSAYEKCKCSQCYLIEELEKE